MDAYSPPAPAGSTESSPCVGSLEGMTPLTIGPGTTPIYAFTTSDPALAAPSPVFLPSGARRPHDPTYPGIFSTSRGSLLPALSLGLSTRYGGAAGPFLPTFTPEHGLVAAHWGPHPSPAVPPPHRSRPHPPRRRLRSP